MSLIQPSNRRHFLMGYAFIILIIAVPFAVCETWQKRIGSSLEFLLSTEEKTCEEAQMFCVERGGHTAILHDPADRQYVNNLASGSTTAIGEKFFIGLYKAEGFDDIWWRDRAVYFANDMDWESGSFQKFGVPTCRCTVQLISSGAWEPTPCDSSVHSFVCSRSQDRCAELPCIHGGTCRQTEGELLGYVCDCISGRTGVSCDDDIDECLLDPAVCRNGATCSNTDGSYDCDCSALGFEGKNCTIDVDECLFDPPVCQNEATCTNTNGSYACECGLSGYEGKNCSSDINECMLDPPLCQNRARCINTDGSYNCDCDATGYEGKHCTSDINECIVDPPTCQNNAMCSNTAGSYSCTCEADFEGRNCDAKINDCATLNGTLLCEPGYCVDGVTIYTCVCPDGSSGTPSCPEESLDGTDLDDGPGSFEDESDNGNTGDAGNLDDSSGTSNGCAVALIFTCLSVVCIMVQQ